MSHIVSPFASAYASGNAWMFTALDLPPSTWKPVDDTRIQINRFVRKQLKIHRTLSHTASVPVPEPRPIPLPAPAHVKRFIHAPGPGTLMVTAKKPFKVRFAPNLILSYHRYIREE